MKRKFKKLDLFGHPITMNFDKNGSTHNTICGAIFSVFIFSIMAMLVFTKTKTMIDYGDQNIILKEKMVFDPKDNVVNMKNTNLTYMYSLARPQKLKENADITINHEEYKKYMKVLFYEFEANYFSLEFKKKAIKGRKCTFDDVGDDE